MAHLRFNFFFSEQRQEVHAANWNFLFILGFQKKPKAKGRGTFKDIFFKKVLEFLGLSPCPQKFWAQKKAPKSCITFLGNFTSFVDHPWIFTCTYYFLNTPENSIPSSSCILSGIAYCTCLNYYFSSFCKKMYKVFFRIIHTVTCTKKD